MSQKDGNITIYFGPGPTINRINLILDEFHNQTGRRLSLSKMIRYLVKQSLWIKHDGDIIKELLDTEI